MRNFFRIKILLVFALFFTTTSITALADKEEPLPLTIFVEKPKYQKAKFEPDNGIYVGAYVIQDVYINSDMNKFNELTEKQHASYFRYVGYGRPFPKAWVDEVKAVGAVPHIAFEPNNGLDEVKDDEYLRQFARDAYEAGVPIFLRYASEMNGTWTHYSGHSKEYIEKWKLVHDVFEQEAPNVAMVWTVFTFPEHTITSFYPGDHYVDWVGVNVYNVMYHNDNLKHRADHEDPLKLLDYVYNTYSYKKPIQISEFGVTHYSSTDGKYYIDFAKEKLTRLYANLPERYPRVKSIFYFDVNNLVNAPEGRKINDYSITNDPDILHTYKTLVSNPKYLTEVVEANSESSNETLTFSGFNFIQKGKTYVDINFFRNHMGLKITIKNNTATISNGVKSVKATIVSKAIPKGFYNENRRIQGLPIREIVTALGYKLSFDPVKNTIRVKN